VQDSYAAEDIVQDYFVELMEGNSVQPASEQELNAYIHKGLLYRTIDHFRRTKRVSQHTTPITATNTDSETEFEILDTLPTRYPTRAIDDELMAHELIRGVLEVEDLNPTEQAILRLKLQGATYADIMYQLDISKTKIKSKLHRVMVKVRNAATFYLLDSGIDITEVSALTGQTEDSIVDSYNQTSAKLGAKQEE
jgi:RNA polymerase sigma factor (sigma-70 family)